MFTVIGGVVVSMNKWLEKAFAEQNNGENPQVAYNKALLEAPDDLEVLNAVGFYYFTIKKYDASLDLFVRAYHHMNQTAEGKKILFEHIYLVYYEPNIEQLREQYINNVQLLKNYAYNYIEDFSEFDQLPILCIPRTETEYYIYYKEYDQFGPVVSTNAIEQTASFSNDDCIIAVNLFSTITLENLAIQTTTPPQCDGMAIPVYIVWHENVMQGAFLQINEYKNIVQMERFIFFSDYSEIGSFGDFFRDPQCIFPNKIIGTNVDVEKNNETLQNIITWQRDRYEKNCSDIKEFMQQYNKDYYRNIVSKGFYKELRILLVTTRFSTFVQYCTRDCMNAFQQLNIRCEILIEKSNIHRVTVEEYAAVFASFKPNAIFQICHFKWEISSLFAGMLGICWVQDDLPHLFLPESIQKLEWNDFMLVQTRRNHNKLLNAGYSKERILHQPVPANPSLYYPRNANEEERARYGADITLVGHAGNPKAGLEEIEKAIMASQLNNKQKNVHIKIMQCAYQIASKQISKGENFTTDHDIRILFADAASHCGAKWLLSMNDWFLRQFKYGVGNPLHRALPLRHIAKMDISLKIWGNGWLEDPDLKEWAMGSAGNGDELAMINSCSKIVLGLNPFGTMNQKALEVMACGTLYLCRYVPPEKDWDHIGDYFVENEDFIFFYNEKDLTNKISYFLNHENERLKVAKNGLKKTLEKFSYKKAMENGLDFIQQRIKTM